jgi:3-hydroxyisobutyrate dehydrogenase
METCDVVLTMLSNDAAVKEVLRDQRFIVCSICWKNHHQYEYGCTGNLALFKHHLQPTSVHFIDAPVSGSVKPAQDGTLVILVGASNEDFEVAKPIFDVLGKIAIHVGEPGWQVQLN